jgi:hypothetical protein
MRRAAARPEGISSHAEHQHADGEKRQQGQTECRIDELGPHSPRRQRQEYCQQDHQRDVSETPQQKKSENEQRNGEHLDPQRPHHADDLGIQQQCISQQLDGLIGGWRANRRARRIEDQYERADGDQDGRVDAKDSRYNKARGIEPIRIRPARQRLQQHETADDEK